MADLCIFKLDSQTINIKDTTARQTADSAKTLATTASGNATTALNKINELENEKADKTLATESANGLMSAADKKAIDREFFRMVPNGGTYIPAKADLNSIEYIKVGNYYNSANVQAVTIKNIPVGNAFLMYVLSPLAAFYDNESTDQWVYRLRIFVDFTGEHIFVQKVSNGSTVGNFTYGPWIKMTNANDLGVVSKIINDHAANKSNPHAVTKAQVGLGNVANLDQSKAIKSITRSGTTFTATALDGTTTTFTQQDSNTTYDIATASADGLMSAADKSKLDGITGQVTADKLEAPDHTTDLVQYGAFQIAAQQIISQIPDYGIATTSAAGLMSSSDKAKLDGIGAGSNVKSVNGKTGAVSLSKADVGLDNVDNTKDADKPVSTAMQTALDKKADKTLATTSANGLMSATDKKALNKINELEKLSRVSISYDSTKENMTITIGTHSVA